MCLHSIALVYIPLPKNPELFNIFDTLFMSSHVKHQTTVSGWKIGHSVKTDHVHEEKTAWSIGDDAAGVQRTPW